MKLSIPIMSASLCSFVIAGDVSPVQHHEDTSVCDGLKNIGKIYKNAENPYIQEIKLFGRAQWQYGYTDGENLKNEKFDEQYTEIRRLRAGAQVKVLNRLKLKARVNLEQGGPDNHRYGMPDFDTATATYTLGDHYGLEDINISYGRQKFTLSSESHKSSRKIKTVERSNIGNFFTSGKRPTGLLVSATKGETDLSAGVYSTEDDSDFIGGWNDGQAYYASVEHGAWLASFVYNDVNTLGGLATEDDIFGFQWASSLAYETKFGRWKILLNGIYGELHNDDAVYGLVVMPTTYLIEDKLEAVARYQYAGSDGDNLRLTNRYAREAGGNRRGDENHTLYAGLNYYLCGHNAKVQAGVEYETLDRSNGEDADAVTFWTAFRMYF